MQAATQLLPPGMLFMFLQTWVSQRDSLKAILSVGCSDPLLSDPTVCRSEKLDGHSIHVLFSAYSKTDGKEAGDQSEASIKAKWLLSTNERPVSKWGAGNLLVRGLRQLFLWNAASWFFEFSHWRNNEQRWTCVLKSQKKSCGRIENYWQVCMYVCRKKLIGICRIYSFHY